MDSYKNSFVLQQGEQLGFNFKLSSTSKKYVPYIISESIGNPYFVITVGTDLHNSNSYKKSWWCKYEGPKFYGTNCIEIDKDKLDALNIIEDSEHDYPYINNQELQFNDVMDNNVLHRYVYHTVIDNEDVYYYFNYGAVTYVMNYECRLIHTFPLSDTKEWNAKNYMYQITLVDGQSMDSYIEQITLQNNIDLDKIYKGTTLSDEELRKTKYNYLKMKLNCFQEDIDEDSPLGCITTVINIVSPKTLISNNNIKTLI